MSVIPIISLVAKMRLRTPAMAGSSGAVLRKALPGAMRLPRPTRPPRSTLSLRYLRPLLALALGVSAHTPALGHDFWIEPDTFRPPTGATVALQLRVGEHFKGDSLIYLPELFERFVYVDPTKGEHVVTGLPGDDPAGKIGVTEPGVTVVGYRSRHASVAFATLAEFENYLTKEGLDRISALRKKLRKPDANIREIYSRAAKSLILTGDGRDRGADRALGFRIELIAEKNPYVLAAGQTLPVRLLYENKPLAGALIVAFNKNAPMEKLKMRSDKNGRVKFVLPRAGTWLVTAVHMIPTPATAHAHWESFWASLTFELPAK